MSLSERQLQYRKVNDAQRVVREGRANKRLLIPFTYPGARPSTSTLAPEASVDDSTIPIGFARREGVDMNRIHVVALALILSTFPVAAGTMCNISGKDEKGVEFILTMEQPGADKSSRQLLAEQLGIVHTEDDNYFPNEIILKQPTGSTKGYSARNCIVRLEYLPKKHSYSERSLIRCAKWGEQLQGVHYKYSIATKLFACEKGCGSNAPRTFTHVDCNQ